MNAIILIDVKQPLQIFNNWFIKHFIDCQQ